jgi:hypothetical protein
MKQGSFLPPNPPSPSNTHFPIEALRAAYEFLQAGIDWDYVMFARRRRGQPAEFCFCKSSELLTLKLPGETTLKLWRLLGVGYNRTRYIPLAYLDDKGYCWTGYLDTSTYLRGDY